MAGSKLVGFEVQVFDRKLMDVAFKVPYRAGHWQRCRALNSSQVTHRQCGIHNASVRPSTGVSPLLRECKTALHIRSNVGTFRFLCCGESSHSRIRSLDCEGFAFLAQSPRTLAPAVALCSEQGKAWALLGQPVKDLHVRLAASWDMDGDR